MTEQEYNEEALEAWYYMEEMQARMVREEEDSRYLGLEELRSLDRYEVMAENAGF